MLTRTFAVSLIILAGQAGFRAGHDSVLPVSVAVAAAPAMETVVVTAPLQLLTSASLDREWFSAHIAGDADADGGPAQMDGAILVVSAVEGPTRRIGRSPQTLRIDIDGGRVDGGLVRFDGLATLEDDEGTVTTFPISGSVGPMEVNADCLIWDILGGNVHETFESIGRLRLN